MQVNEIMTPTVALSALADLSRSEDEATQGALKDIAQPSGKPRR
jgi:hypothetical protein